MEMCPLVHDIIFAIYFLIFLPIINIKHRYTSNLKLWTKLSIPSITWWSTATLRKKLPITHSRIKMEPTTAEKQLQQWQQLQRILVESPVSAFPMTCTLPGCYWTWQELNYWLPWSTLLPGEWEQAVAKQLLRDQYLRTLSVQQLRTVAAQQQRELQTAAAGRAKKRVYKPTHARRQERRQRERTQQAKEQERAIDAGAAAAARRGQHTQ